MVAVASLAASESKEALVVAAPLGLGCTAPLVSVATAWVACRRGWGRLTVVAMRLQASRTGNPASTLPPADRLSVPIPLVSHAGVPASFAGAGDCSCVARGFGFSAEGFGSACAPFLPFGAAPPAPSLPAGVAPPCCDPCRCVAAAGVAQAQIPEGRPVALAFAGAPGLAADWTRAGEFFSVYFAVLFWTWGGFVTERFIEVIGLWMRPRRMLS